MKKKSGKKRSKRKKFDIKKTWQFKLLIICIIILIGLIIAYIFIYEPAKDKDLEGELATIGPSGYDNETGVYFPLDCSTTSLESVWNTIFLEGFTGVEIVANNSGGICEQYLLRKFLPNNITYVIWGLNQESSSEIHYTVYAIYSNLTDSSINYLKTIDESSFGGILVSAFILDLIMGNNVQGERNINSINEADLEFSNIFVMDNGTWEMDDEIGEVYMFGNKGDGVVYINKTLNIFLQSEYTFKPINLTQTQNIPDFQINESYSYIYLFELRDYIDNVGMDDNLSFVYEVSPSGISISRNNQYVYLDTSSIIGGNFKINITLSHPDWNSGANVTTNTFDINVNGCLDSDSGMYDYNTKGTAQNSTANKTDYCSGNSLLIEHYCSDSIIRDYNHPVGSGYYCVDGAKVVNTSVEHAPSFNGTACDDLEWDINTNYSLNMTKCWYDDDGDAIQGYRFEDDNENLTIIQSGNVLKLIPDYGWYDDGDFDIYANDSKNESRGDVDFNVKNITIVVNTSTNDSAPNNPNIKSSIPSSNTISIFPDSNKSFSITAEYYDEIKWYLNGALVKSDVLSFSFNNLKDGDIVKVDIINGTRVDSKTWNIEIEDDEDIEEPVVEMGVIVFYLIVTVVCIIIFLVIWLFINEKNKKHRGSVGVGFGFVESKNKSGTGSKEFNIPG